LYSKLTDKKVRIGPIHGKALSKDFIGPGPGAYETNPSSVMNPTLAKKLLLNKQSKCNIAQSPSG